MSSSPPPVLPCVRMATRIPNRISIVARVSRLGRGLTVAFPAQPAGILPFLPPIQPKPELFSAWERDVFRSVDGGASWERLDVDLPDSSRGNEMCALVVAET